MLTPCVALVVDDEEAAAAWAAALKRAMVLASVKMGPDEDEPMAAVAEDEKNLRYGEMVWIFLLDQKLLEFTHHHHNFTKKRNK